MVLGQTVGGYETFKISMGGRILAIGDYAIASGKNMVSVDFKIGGYQLSFDKNGDFIGFNDGSNTIYHTQDADGDYSGGMSSYGGETIEGYTIKNTLRKFGYLQNMGGIEGKANWFLGLSASSLEASSSTYRVFSEGYGFSSWVYSKNYPDSNYFNRYSFSKLGKGLGRASFVIGFALDIRAYYNKEISFPKLSFNTGMGLYGLEVNPFAGSVYFGVDAFYPGGWNGAMNDQQRLDEENKFNPYWQLWPATKQ